MKEGITEVGLRGRQQDVTSGPVVKSEESSMTTSLPPVRSSLSVLPLTKLPPLFTSIRRAESGGSIRLIVAGELDLAARDRFDADLAEAQDHSDRVLIDLRALTFIDCACLATLFVAAGHAQREGAALILVGPLVQVRRLLDLIGSPPGVAVLDHGDLHEQPVAA
jgi:anti-anti-sigma factor